VQVTIFNHYLHSTGAQQFHPIKHAEKVASLLLHYSIHTALKLSLTACRAVTTTLQKQSTLKLHAT